MKKWIFSIFNFYTTKPEMLDHNWKLTIEKNAHLTNGYVSAK
jgi:hypothetical protein